MDKVKKIKEMLNEKAEAYKTIRRDTYCRKTETDDCDSCRADHYLDARLDTIMDAIKIVNQVEEEYVRKTDKFGNSEQVDDVCEWHKVKNGNAYKSNEHEEIHDYRVLDWCVCPYCGKKIKVVE